MLDEIWRAKQLGYMGRSPHTDCDAKCPHHRLGVEPPEGNIEVATPLPRVYAKGKSLVSARIQAEHSTLLGESFMVEERGSLRILGAHIIGPYASILIQEIINLMYTEKQDARPLMESIHIHPSMSEVVDRAFSSLIEPREYHHMMEHEHLSG